MDKEIFNVEEHTTLDGRVLDVFPISHIYIHELEKQVKKQKEVINNAIEYIKNNVYEEDNGCGDYWWEIADKDELLKILQDKEVSE